MVEMTSKLRHSLAFFAAMLLPPLTGSAQTRAPLAPTEARAIAEEAYIFGMAIVTTFITCVSPRWNRPVP